MVCRESESVAIRVKPMGYKVFMESDFETQHRLLTVLDRETPVRVPPMLWFEDDDSVLGAPFFVMRKLQGHPAPDQPPYNQGGWLYEASPELRRRCWRNAIDALVTVHAVPTETVAFLAKPELGATGFDQIYEYWRRSFEWAADGGEYRIAAAALEWMDANQPADKPTALSWGDCRMGNILFHEGEVTGCLDWEMLSLGGHQMDLGWWLHLDAFHSFGVPRLEGLGGRSETIELWEEGTGEKATDLLLLRGLRRLPLRHRPDPHLQHGRGAGLRPRRHGPQQPGDPPPGGVPRHRAAAGRTSRRSDERRSPSCPPCRRKLPDGRIAWASSKLRPFRALAHPQFRVVWGTFIVGQLGFWVAFLALQALMADLTDTDGTWLGLLFFTNFIPMLVFTPLAGVVADRYERRRVLMVGFCALSVIATASPC